MNIKSQAWYKGLSDKGMLNRKSLFVVAVTLFIGFALYEMTSVEAHPTPSVTKNAPPQRIDLPAVPILSFAEEGLTGTEQLKWHRMVLQSGQTLSGIFTELGLSQGLLLKIIGLNDDSSKLARIYPGAALEIALAHDGEFMQLRYRPSEDDELVIHNDMSQLSTEIIEHPKQVHLANASGVITDSLFQTGKRAGLSDNMVMKLAHIFSWDIDFVLEIRSGDRFSVIYEQIYQDGEYLRDGNILAATFTNQGETFEAVYYDADEDLTGYYAPNGRSMKKAFLRAPVKFSAIVSNFNPKRMHPILKRVKPHRGIDYGAPTGTPVFAAGNGRVTHSAYSKANGNYVFIQHPNGIVTKYLHFSKRKVKKGEKVKQGQTIGLVGATGLATGPHLHYEFIYNGVHRNPRTVQLPKSEPLPDALLSGFRDYASPLLTQLHAMDEPTLAQNN